MKMKNKRKLDILLFSEERNINESIMHLEEVLGTLSFSMLKQIINLINDSLFKARAKPTSALNLSPRHYIKMESFKCCREKALSLSSQLQHLTDYPHVLQVEDLILGKVVTRTLVLPLACSLLASPSL